MNSCKNPISYWLQSSFTFKLYLLIQILLSIFYFRYPGTWHYFVDNPLLIVKQFEIWRLFVSMFGYSPDAINALKIVIGFLWIYKFVDDKRYSTVYRFFEIIILHFEIHFLFIFLCLVLSAGFGSLQSMLYFASGWLPLIIVYEFRKSAIHPEGSRKLPCLPFKIKSKYHPWIYFLLITIVSQQLVCCLASCIIGYFQEFVFKGMFIKLPLSFYKKIDAWMPQFIRKRSDYATVGFAEQDLLSRCCGSASNFSTECSAIDGKYPNGYDYWKNNEISTETNSHKKISIVQIEQKESFDLL